MAALNADRITEERDENMRVYGVATSTTIYKGALVALNTSGYLVPAADTAGLQVVGVAQEGVVNSGANGAKTCLVRRGRTFRLDATSITKAMEGQKMFVVDDHTFDEGQGTNGVVAGYLAEFVSATEGWLWIPKHTPTEGILTADADATYGQPEADLINEMKDALNKA